MKYVELDILKLSKKCNHVVIQHILKHHNISLKKQKIFTILKNMWEDKGIPCFKKCYGFIYLNCYVTSRIVPFQ